MFGDGKGLIEMNNIYGEAACRHPLDTVHALLECSCFYLKVYCL